MYFYFGAFPIQENLLSTLKDDVTLAHLDVIIERKNNNLMGSGCGSVGRVVTSDTRGLQFEASYRQNFIWNICLLSTVFKRLK